MGNVPATPSPPQLRIRTQVADENASSTTRAASPNGNRRLISRYLRRIGKHSSNDLSLDTYGFCYLPFKRFLIIIGVPDDGTGLLYFRAMIFDLDSARGISKVHKKVAAANLTALKLGKRGSYLMMEGDEISLALETRIKGLSYGDMAELLEDFMDTAVKTNAKLEAIR
jgi:hypothetical protein